MKKILITIILFYPSAFLFSQGYQVHVQGQKQQAMGNTGTALAQDAAITFYNPGGVSLLQGNGATLGGNAAIVKSAFLSSTAGGDQVNTTTPISFPFTAYGVYGLDSNSNLEAPFVFLKNMKFGLGVYTAFGGGVTYPDEWIGRFIVNSTSLKTLSIQPTISYNISNKLGIGVGFVYSIGTLAKNQDLPPLDADTSVALPNLDLSGKLSGMGFNAGVYFQPTEKLSFGLTYRSQTNMDVKDGTITLSNIPALLADSLPSGKFTTTYPLPQVITLGGAYKLMDGQLVITSDICFTGFKVLDSLKLDSETNTGAWKKIKKTQPKNYQNAYSFRLGGQFEIIEGLFARVGARYVMSAIPEANITPEGADANRFVYTGGVGYEVIEGLIIDASYSFESLKRENINNPYYRFAGTYKTYASIIGLSVSYKF